MLTPWQGNFGHFRLLTPTLATKDPIENSVARMLNVSTVEIAGVSSACCSALRNFSMGMFCQTVPANHQARHAPRSRQGTGRTCMERKIVVAELYRERVAARELE
jgi:hypothetical protein